ncbi:hypothetical protein B0H63DRAFT_472237 [Podospora didyma]|uniref:Uncharacterized protein n=1 Tax=Podospora didyma TaxID=330526 RepID=A0AAE0NP01_9PEZI|nr:hypothetical protein B0H63DRAFT_472237 [Podospora didyma]
MHSSHSEVQCDGSAATPKDPISTYCSFFLLSFLPILYKGDRGSISITSCSHMLIVFLSYVSSLVTRKAGALNKGLQISSWKFGVLHLKVFGGGLNMGGSLVYC